MRDGRSPVPAGYGLVSSGRVRTDDYVWDHDTFSWKLVSEDWWPEQDRAEFLTAVARQICHPDPQNPH